MEDQNKVTAMERGRKILSLVSQNSKDKFLDMFNINLSDNDGNIEATQPVSVKK